MSCCHFPLPFLPVVLLCSRLWSPDPHFSATAQLCEQRLRGERDVWCGRGPRRPCSLGFPLLVGWAPGPAPELALEQWSGWAGAAGGLVGGPKGSFQVTSCTHALSGAPWTRGFRRRPDRVSHPCKCREMPLCASSRTVRALPGCRAEGRAVLGPRSRAGRPHGWCGLSCAGPAGQRHGRSAPEPVLDGGGEHAA